MSGCQHCNPPNLLQLNLGSIPGATGWAMMICIFIAWPLAEQWSRKKIAKLVYGNERAPMFQTVSGLL